MHTADLAPVKRLIQKLDRTDRYIVMLYYADDLTRQEIAHVLNISAEHVDQTLNRLRPRLLGAIERCERAAA